ncbi:MAG: universal stress protein [Pseudomonadota bacterium]
MYQKIIVAVDVERPESAATALAAAEQLAALGEAALCVVSVRADDAALTTFAFGEAVKELAAAVKARSGLDVGWRAVDDDDVDEGLERIVEELEPDLVVIGAHEPTWLEIFTGPTIRDFVAKCEASLLIAR